MASYELMHVTPGQDRRTEERRPRELSQLRSFSFVSSLLNNHGERSSNEEGGPDNDEEGSNDGEERELIPAQTSRSEPNKHDSQDEAEVSSQSGFESTWKRTMVSSSNPMFTTESAKAHLSSENAATWQPFWLRQDVLGAFALVYILLAVVLLTLLVISRRQNGLLEAREELEILWKFAPTALVTLMATFWGRVEFQTLRYFPWAVVQHEPQVGHDIYTLDYTAIIPVRVMLRALQRRHLFVVFIILASIILKVQVVLGPSLFYLENTPVTRPVQVQLRDTFSILEPEDRGALPLFGLEHAAAVQRFEMSRPFGVAEQAAYQTFQVKDEKGLSRGTIEKPVTAVVDGVFMDMKCLPSTNFSMSKPFEKGGKNGDDYVSVLDLQFEGCEELVKFKVQLSAKEVKAAQKAPYWAIVPLFLEKEDEGKTDYTSEFIKSRVNASWEDNPRHICSSLPRQFPPFVYFAGFWTPSKSNDSIYEIEEYGSVICSPRGWTSKVEVTDDGITPNLTTLSDQESTPLNINPWNIVAGIHGMRATDSKFMIGPMLLLDMVVDLPDTDHYGGTLNQVLLNSVLNLTRITAPMILSYQLRQTNEIETTGLAQFNTRRLQVRFNACIAIIVLWVLASLIASTALVKSSPKFKIWTRNPTTMLGSILFFGSDSKLSRTVEQRLFETRASYENVWRQWNYSPPSLTAWARCTFAIYSASLIITLGITLQISETSNGLATVDNNALSIWWTIVPALAMVLVALYTSSSDSEIRKLCVHFCAKKRPCVASELDMCLLDMLGLHALYRSFKLRVFVITLSQSLAIACGFLAALSSLLFTTFETREWVDTTFDQKSSFANKENSSTANRNYHETLASLVATYELSNFTWPKGTYGSLLFPTLETDALALSGNNDLVIDLVTPAATLWPSCNKVSIVENVKIKGPIPDSKMPVTISFQWKFTCSNGEEAAWSQGFPPSALVDGKYYFSGSFATSEVSDCDNEGFSKSVTYLWGSASYNSSVPDYSIWMCSYTWMEVPTRARMKLVNGTFQFDQGVPPEPDYTIMKPWSPPFNTSAGMDLAWPTVAGTGKKAAGTFGAFAMLMSPFGKFELQDLENPDKEEEILEQLHTKRAILASLSANAGSRVEVNDTSSADPKLSKIDAKISFGKMRRLKQNPTITCMIIAILSVTFLVNVWALISSVLARFLDSKTKWLLDMQMKDVAPDEFGSIMMVESLIHGSNCAKYRSKECYLEKLEVVHGKLSDLRFRIGSFLRKGATEREVTLGVLDDEDFQFLGT
ncbi:unnamed protein product [Clonostachys rosea]|uniref:Uncharacterized protein n=1 Tax=Bionectria ochroleuca TaxID=29856 RepID=A0ABY6UWH8_BIOOC|nr:unnamed protein product [Clonostachys rosea]